ncbi:Putative uncharacterized protein [Taphrina deformans PYCC 5710]|uniref:PH domain protein n=1 Tax=Taphrina deformans (strain PYCC 5710 / ATCC 11124 / CBS 356.35 / IMI 108563 / JCM 9778 / NBRC 8474) TaxID=1097556 RepID=R4X7H7_TAPDE|nr:Putative uncharacterized protein [Taphrina deformans PYCC 5710]|eukprot:CCG81043.1 Putative uncharacterized protein [Taphrina deformans PYCC 5710]
MSGLIMKYLFKRNLPDLRFGADPYFEADDTHRKKFKQTPAGLSQKDAKVLKKVRRRAYRLDQSISCCCCSFRVGWAAIIGIIPVIGDVIDALLAMRIISTAKSIDGGLPESVVAQMYANVVVDFGIGLIPFVGDIADMIYKCNTRNLQILEKYLLKKSGQAPNGTAAAAATTGAVPNTAVNPPAGAHIANNSHHHHQQQQPVQSSQAQPQQVMGVR